ncbi:MAG: hypothetical protein CML66_28085 [Rhodobacteraceae bacterium]|nr:hypothetical protein [Paracoccaceae bacterium]MAY47689.1 hypothetical protein [Paracoccaceae bacterium]|tara:strand:+ start:1256 stop:2236 length:981 start_codon:yes stop_codon:yes gene_type:complete
MHATAPTGAPVRSQTSPPAPVFVYGALRSGTTLLRLILDRHDLLSNPGEVDFLFDWIHRDPSNPTGWSYDFEALGRCRIFRSQNLTIPPDCDGRDLLEEFCRQFSERDAGVLTLNVHRNADKMAELMPDARIIHILRDPRDVTGSAIGMGWAGTYFHGVEPWLRTESAWDGIAPGLSPEQVFELHYESLLSDTRATLEALCRFLGVSFSPTMLEYHRTSTYDPIDPKLSSKWRRKLSPRDVALIEGRAAQLMAARGYEPSGEGYTPKGIDLCTLTLRNKLAIWRFGMRRHGGGLYWSEKASRWLGLRGWHDRISARIDENVIRNLK